MYILYQALIHGSWHPSMAHLGLQQVLTRLVTATATSSADDAIAVTPPRRVHARLPSRHPRLHAHSQLCPSPSLGLTAAVAAVTSVPLANPCLICDEASQLAGASVGTPSLPSTSLPDYPQVPPGGTMTAPAATTLLRLGARVARGGPRVSAAPPPFAGRGISPSSRLATRAAQCRCMASQTARPTIISGAVCVERYPRVVSAPTAFELE